MKLYLLIIILIILTITYLFFKISKKSENLSNNYYISIRNTYINNIIESILKNRKMNKISYQNLQSTKLIGFYLANSENQNITKSQNSYGIYFENLNILNSSVYYSKYFKNKNYFPNYIIFQKNKIISNFNILNEYLKKNKTNLFILKDINKSYFKIILDLSNKEDKYKNYIIENLKLFPSNFILCHEYYESVKFKIKDIQISNSNKISYRDTVIKRSLTRFFILVICKRNNFYFYKINSFLNYLSISPINDNLKDNSSYFINNVGNINNDHTDKYKKLVIEKKYPLELFSELYCLTNKYFKNQKPEKFNILNEKIDDFISDFSDSFFKELIPYNDIYFNDNFISSFNIFTIDSILTTNNELKILKIENSFINKDFTIFEKNTNIINFTNILNDIFKIMVSDYKNSKEVKLISTKYKTQLSKLYYLNEFQIRTYPEILTLLKKRNYSRSVWKSILNSKNNINLYIGYSPKNKGFNKILYINGLHKFYKNYNISNKIEGAIYNLGDKSTFYNKLKNTNLIADFVNFTILKNIENENFIKTSELIKIQNFIVANQTTCNRFILKPSLGSQGDSIEIIRYFEDFESWIKMPKKYLDWSICEFLEPKLFKSLKINDEKKRKAHIRNYFIIVNNNNNIKIYELKHRILYFAVDKYINKCVKITSENKYSFITNLALASEERDIYYDTKEFTDNLLNYQNQIFNFKKLSNTLTEYGLKCISTLKDSDFKCFSNSKKSNCYQVIAIDYLPINKNQVKVLEVNKGPGYKALKINFDFEAIYDEIFKVSIDLFDNNKNYDNDLIHLKRLI